MKNMIAKLQEEKVQECLAALGMVALFLLISLPLVLISKYNIMSGDDYKYLNLSQTGLTGKEGIVGIAVAQIRNAYGCWKTWQGQFFANWMIMTFLAIFGPEGYHMVIWFTWLPLAVADFFLVYVLLKRLYAASFSRIVLAAVPLILVHISSPVSTVEGLYWLCGAFTYTTVYALSLLIAGLYVNLFYVKSKWGTGLHYAVLLFLTFCLAGGNFVTGLFMTLFLLLAVIPAFLLKKHRIFVCGNLVLYLLTFLMVAFSPGTSNRREENIAAKSSAVKAVLMSLWEAFRSGNPRMQPYLILLAIALIPLFWKIAGKMKYRYPLPGLVLIFTFGLYAAHFAPNQYALSFLGAYRVQNVYRFQFIWWVLGNEFYLLGYLQKKLKEKNQQEKHRKWKLPFATLLWSGAMVIIVGMNMKLSMGGTCAPLSAYWNLKDGSAKQYYAEYLERLELFEDDSMDEVVLKPYTSTPYALYFGDFEDRDFWINMDCAETYHKKAIWVEKMDEVLPEE